jgi:hypothetical protein
MPHDSLASSRPFLALASLLSAPQSWLEGLNNLPALRTLELNACNVASLEGCGAHAHAHA